MDIQKGTVYFVLLLINVTFFFDHLFSVCVIDELLLIVCFVTLKLNLSPM